MAEPPHSSGDEVPTTSRRTRGATRLRQLILRRSAGERTPIVVDVVTGVASGPNADVFRSYLGVLARDRISILTPSFDHVSEADRELIWQDLLMTFEMPNVESLRNRCLSVIAERFRGFKTKLTTTYIFGAKKNESPCSKYFAIDEETWRQFVLQRTSEAWQETRSKTQGISAQNKNPHLLSRGGYKKLEEKIMKQKSDNRLSASEGGDPLPPPSPPSRHEKWKLARLRPSGSYTSDTARDISERIDTLVEQSSQGQFTQEGRQDILATAIGRPEHPGRVRAAGTGIGIRQFFGSSSRPSSSGLTREYEEKLREEITRKVRADLYEEVVEMVARQFQQRYEDYGNRPPPSPVAEHVVPPTGRSGKGSCSTAGGPGDDMDDTRPCLLYILSDTGTQLVARGTLYETATVVHGVQLAEDEVKVTVDEVVDPNAVLPVPTDEFLTVEEAFHSFVAWPRHLVGDVSAPPLINQGGSPTPKKTRLSEDDPLGALDELGNLISSAPMIVHWDFTTFGRDSQIPLYLHQQDVLELASGREEINITLIQLWMMYMSNVSNKKGFSNVYGFIEPSMTHERNKFDDIQTYITSCFGMGKEIYFLPYILGRHWQLLVISIPENTAVWFCSLEKSPPSPLKHVVDCSLATHMMLSEKSTATTKKLSWLPLKCNRQSGSYECGYYVMFWIMTIIRAHYTSGWHTRFNVTSPIPEKTLKLVRKTLAKYIVHLYNSMQ